MAKDTVSEQEIQLRKKARRRLVGAAALAILAAIFLPLILDGELKPIGDQVSIQIPDKKSAEPLSPISSAEVALPVSTSQAASNPQAVANSSAPAAANQAVAPSKPVAEKTPAAKIEQKSADKQDEIKTRQKPVVAKAQDKSAEKPAAKVQDAPAKSAEKAKVAEAKSEGQYVVQLGVFGNAANVRDLRAKLAAGNIKTYTESLQGGEKTRVRAGPYASRDEAEAARAKLKLLGFDGVVANK